MQSYNFTSPPHAGYVIHPHQALHAVLHIAAQVLALPSAQLAVPAAQAVLLGQATKWRGEGDTAGLGCCFSLQLAPAALALQANNTKRRCTNNANPKQERIRHDLHEFAAVGAVQRAVLRYHAVIPAVTNPRDDAGQCRQSGGQ